MCIGLSTIILSCTPPSPLFLTFHHHYHHFFYAFFHNHHHHHTLLHSPPNTQPLSSLPLSFYHHKYLQPGCPKICFEVREDISVGYLRGRFVVGWKSDDPNFIASLQQYLQVDYIILIILHVTKHCPHAHSPPSPLPFLLLTLLLPIRSNCPESL